MIEPAPQLVTVFGGGGFIGRYVCEILLKKGHRVRVAQREPRTAHFLQPLGQVGQIGFVRADLTRPDQVRAAVEGASAVVNLCGVFAGKVYGTHVDGARSVAEAARDCGVEAVVQISAIGADPAAQSTYGSTKGEGEAAVRSAFPAATIIRPSVVFGPEDNLTNRLAGLSWLPAVPVIRASCKFQPVYVRDLAQAIAKAALDPENFGGKTFEIGGPRAMTMRELVVQVQKAAGQERDLVEMPDFASSLMSRFGFLPGAPLSRDQWLMLQRDNVPAEGMPGLEAFGIEPTPLGTVAPAWLGRFGGSRFQSRKVNMTATN
ncbi:MAG: complex I NDUFA9 subunit family protein [Pseudomonadota bacterium]|nr:complex I NDUFA9 subunit family protein [Pseudomonadota bacterium]